MGSNARLRGQARRTRQQLTGQLAAIERETRAHLRLCAQCAHAGLDYYKRCDEGWRMIKQQTKATYAICKYDDNHPDTQQGMFE